MPDIIYMSNPHIRETGLCCPVNNIPVAPTARESYNRTVCSAGGNENLTGRPMAAEWSLI